MNTRTLVLAGSALALFFAGWTVNGWRVGLQLQSERAAHNATREIYQQRLAEGLAEAQAKRDELQARTNQAITERDAEIARLADAASRIPDVIRVRVPATCPSVPATADPVPGDAESDDLPGGVLPEGVGGDHQELDIRRVTELMRRADQLSADLRAVVAACQAD